MQMSALVIAGVAMAGLFAAPPRAEAQSGPQWKVGDTWQVGLWQGQAHLRLDAKASSSQASYKTKGRQIKVTFHVSELQAAGEQELYEVQMDFPRERTGFQRRYLLEYAKDTGRLIRIQNVSVRADGKSIQSEAVLPAQRGPQMVEEGVSPMLLDWPDWTRANVTPEGDESRESAQSTLAISETAGSNGGQEREITLTRQTERKEVRVVQRWGQGLPWWREAKKFDDGQLVAEATLLTVNGEKVK